MINHKVCMKADDRKPTPACRPRIPLASCASVWSSLAKRSAPPVRSVAPLAALDLDKFSGELPTAPVQKVRDRLALRSVCRGTKPRGIGGTRYHVTSMRTTSADKRGRF